MAHEVEFVWKKKKKENFIEAELNQEGSISSWLTPKIFVLWPFGPSSCFISATQPINNWSESSGWKLLKFDLIMNHRNFGNQSSHRFYFKPRCICIIGILGKNPSSKHILISLGAFTIYVSRPIFRIFRPLPPYLLST